MKIRTGFVTNSSSSSFILGFKDKDAMREFFKEHTQTSDQNQKWYELLENDVLNEKVISKKEAKDIFYEEVSEMVKWDILWKLDNRFEMKYDELMKVDISKELNEKMDTYMKDFDEKIKDKEYFVEVDYGDDTVDGGYMEHEFVPALNCCMQRFSHH